MHISKFACGTSLLSRQGRLLTCVSLGLALLGLTSVLQADVLIPLNSNWEVLNPGALANDPALTDADFNTTFMTPALYDGPAFGAPQQALLGFGVMDITAITGENFKSTITDPGVDNRYTVYVRQTFTTTQAYPALNVDILADDGGIIYIDGVEVGRINFTGAAETFGTFTPGNVTGIENAYTNVPLTIAGLAAGTHTFVMSVHQAANNSSDLGFNLQLNDTVAQFGAVLPPAKTNFSEPAAAAINYVRGTNPPGTELGFTTTGGTPQGVTDYNGDKQFQVNNAGATFRSELIDLRTTGAVKAGIDLRTYDLSSGFEVADFMRAFVEVSTDGMIFTRMNFFDSNGIDGNDNDPLDSLEAVGGGVNGPLTHFSLNIDASIATLRFGVDALNNSANEFLIWDNLTLVLSQFPGDADGSGTVDFTDLGILLNNYNQTGTFETGDFDGSGTVDFTDLGILLNNYNQSAPTLTTAAPVPEPSSIALAGIGLVGMLLVLRRKRA